jgi:hypothetical protein
MYKFFVFFESTALVLFYLRLLWFVFKKDKEFKINILITTIISIWTVNFLAYYFLTDVHLFYYYHAFSPITISFILIFKNQFGNTNILLASFLGGLALIIVSNVFIYVLIYYLAIGTLLWQSIAAVNQRGKYIQRASLYFLFALNLFVSLFSLVLKDTHVNWYKSLYLSYFQLFEYSIYSFTYVLIHVKFRRFFTY